jgi:hypothetical protein
MRPWLPVLLVRSDLRCELVAAIKARDAVAVSALRSALAAIADAEAIDAPHATSPGGDANFAGSAVRLTDDEVEGVRDA